MPRFPWSPRRPGANYGLGPSFPAAVTLRRELDTAHSNERSLETMIWGVVGQYRANISARRIWDAYQHNELVYAAVRETVDSLASLPFYGERWMEKGQRWQRLSDIHPLPSFLARPSSQLDPVRFWSRFNTHVALFGNGLARKVKARGKLTELVGIRPDMVVMKEGISRPIDGYYVFSDPRRDTFGTGASIAAARIPQDKARYTRYDPSDILHVPLEPDPDFELWGQSPIVPALPAIVTDEAITAFLVNFFQRGALTQWVFTSKLPLSPQDRRRMKAEWENQTAGVDQAWGIAFLSEADGSLTRAGLATGDREIGLHALRMDVEARILSPLNVPPIMVGAAIGLEHMTYCVAPSTRVLCDDLHWREAQDLAVGQGLVACDEEPERGAGGRRGRRLKRGQVIRTGRAILNSYRVTFEDGTSVVASADHPWLVTRHHGGMGWIRTADLIGGAYVLKVCDTWEKDTTKEAGWLAGLYDGEGTVFRGPGAQVNFSQKSGQILAKVKDLLAEKGFPFSEYDYPSNAAVQLRLGGRANMLRFLGSIRPQRLLERSDWLWEGGRLTGPKVYVTRVEHLGPTEVITLATDTHTFIAEGFVSHNSNYREARFAMHEENSEPNLSRLEAALTFSIAPEFAEEGEILRVRVGTDRVMALEEWRSARSERMRGELRDSGILVNEFRAGVEMPPLDIGDALLIDLQRPLLPAVTANTRPPLPLPDWRVAALATALQRKASVDDLIDKQIGDSIEWTLMTLGATRQAGSVNRPKVGAEVKLALTRYPPYDDSRAVADEARRFLVATHANTVHFVCRALKLAFPALFDQYGGWRYDA